MTFLLSALRKDGITVKGKFVFELLQNGNIRQYQEETTDGGKTFNVVFDFTYNKREYFILNNSL